MAKATNLADKIDTIWQANRTKFEQNLCRWFTAFKELDQTIAQTKVKSGQWNPIMLYTSVSKPKGVFSLRFLGQEVAQLVIKNNKPLLKLQKHSQKNKQWFDKKFLLEDGLYRLDGDVFRKFIGYFKNLVQQPERIRIRSPEHRVESKVIIEMLKGSGKFGREDLKIKPVMIAGIPLQIPVPISANTGVPLSTTGHIDILARRRGKDNRVRLSLWELKKPNEYKNALRQAYIYSVVLLKTLRDLSWGWDWYNLFGFNNKSRKLPGILEIEFVVVITRDKKNDLDKELTKYKQCMPLRIRGDLIKPYLAYYDETKNPIIIEDFKSLIAK